MFLTFLTSICFIYGCNSVVICTSGDCNINCNSVNCNKIICTNKASSCTINCQDGQCQKSQLYLAAAINTINCDENLCDNASIECGNLDLNISIHECSLVLLNDARPINTHMYCHNNAAICQCIGNNCDLIHKVFDVESTIKDDTNLSKTSSDKNNTGFVYILLFIFIGILLMTFAICCCIRILYEYRRKIIEIQLDQQPHSVSRNESEQILENANANTKNSQQPYIVYSCVASMVTVPSIPIQNRNETLSNIASHSDSSILEEQDASITEHVFINDDGVQ